MKINTFVCLGILLLVTSLPVAASDFLFQVPVQLDRIPKGIPQAKITCNVYSYRDNQTPIATGYSIKPIDLNSGNLHQEIDVHVNFIHGYSHLEPHQYRCNLLLLTPWAKPSWQTPSPDSDIVALQPRQDSELVSTVSGVIPTVDKLEPFK